MCISEVGNQDTLRERKTLGESSFIYKILISYNLEMMSELYDFESPLYRTRNGTRIEIAEVKLQGKLRWIGPQGRRPYLSRR